jgi:hypothetical protein
MGVIGIVVGGGRVILVVGDCVDPLGDEIDLGFCILASLHRKHKGSVSDRSKMPNSPF